MSVVKAYRCDYCGKIKDEKHIVGIEPREDMFNRLESFKMISNNTKTNVHHCTDCYRERVTIPASKINRKKDENAYKLEVQSLYFAMKAKCVSNVRTKVFTDERKAKDYPGYYNPENVAENEEI